MLPGCRIRNSRLHSRPGMAHSDSGNLLSPIETRVAAPAAGPAPRDAEKLQDSKRDEIEGGHSPRGAAFGIFSGISRIPKPMPGRQTKTIAKQTRQP